MQDLTLASLYKHSFSTDIVSIPSIPTSIQNTTPGYVQAISQILKQRPFPRFADIMGVPASKPERKDSVRPEDDELDFSVFEDELKTEEEKLDETDELHGQRQLRERNGRARKVRSHLEREAHFFVALYTTSNHLRSVA
jgi:hypothetical protein